MAVKAHCPEFGVKVYVPETVLLTVAGDQVPVMPFTEVAGSVGTPPPEQMDNVVPNVNVGVTFGFTVTLKVALSAHCPASGVNVYVPDAVLLTAAGDHVPVMPLVDVAGKAGTVPPSQTDIDVPKENEGVTFGAMVTLKEVERAH